MKKLKFILPIAIAAVLMLISCDNKNSGTSKETADNTQSIPGWTTFGLKGKVQKYEVVSYQGMEWDNEKQTVIAGKPYMKEIYLFGENGVLNSVRSFAYIQAQDSAANETLISTEKYLYDDNTRIIGYERHGFINESDSLLKEKETYKYEQNKVVVDCLKKDNESSDRREYALIMNLDADGRIVNNYPSEKNGASVEEDEYETISKIDSKDNVVEQAKIEKVNGISTGKTYVRVHSYKKMNITYYDGAAGEGKMLKKQDLATPTYLGQTLSQNSKGIVSAITIDDYTRVGVEDNGIDTLKNIPRERIVYKYDKNGIHIETEIWRLYRMGQPAQAALYLAQSEAYTYDDKLRKISQTTKKYLTPVDGQSRETTLAEERITYDDSNKTATSVNTITYIESGSQQAIQNVYALNEQCYITGTEQIGLGVNSTGFSNQDPLEKAKEKESWHKTFYEESDDKGNWTKRTLSYAVYDSTGKFKERIISDYRTRAISYY